MARAKQPPILLHTTEDGDRIELVEVKRNVRALRFVGTDGDVELGSENPALTAAD